MSTEGTRDPEADAPTREAPLEESAGPTPPPRDPHWWGETVVDGEAVVRVVAGPLTVWARRRAKEWAIATVRGGDAQAGDAERGHVVSDDDVKDAAATARFSFAEAPSALLVRPALADRPVVIRPESPLTVPGGERVTLFVSTPVWVTLSVGRPSRVRRRRGRRPASRRDEDATEDVRLTEIPSQLLSDTWFGSSTLVGELCYASRTAGRLALDELPIRPNRAVTPVTIDNRSTSVLLVQRVLVSLPTLALYTDQGGGLWTQGVTLTREGDVDHALARVDGAPPTVLLGTPERLAEPRSSDATPAVMRAFSRLFRGEG